MVLNRSSATISFRCFPMIILMMAVIISAYLAPMVPFLGGARAESHASSVTRQDTIDIPTWYPGERWEYYTQSTISYSGLEMDTTGNTTLIVNPVNPIINWDQNGSFKVYNIVVTGEQQFSGEFAGIATIVGNTTISGYRYYRVEDLAVVKEHILTSGQITITYLGTPQTYPFADQTDTSYLPVMEEWDFPMAVGEVWALQTEMSIYISTQDVYESQIANYSYSCIGEENIHIYHPSEGIDLNYDTYKVKVDGENETTYKYYGPSVKNWVKFSLDMPGMGVGQLELMDYSPGVPAIDVEDLAVSPTTAMIGESVTVSGRIVGAVAPGELRIIIPSQSDVVLTNFIGSFSETVSAPIIADDTPTANDVGSHGILVIFSGAARQGYGVVTITVDGADLAATGLNVSSTGSETIEGDLLDIVAEFKNPSRTDISEPFKITIFIDGTGIKSQTLQGLNAGASASLTTQWTALDTSKEHLITASIDVDGSIMEYDEDNNDITIGVTVVPNQAPIIDVSFPTELSQTIDEEDYLDFSVSASDPDGDEVVYNWFVNNNQITDEHAKTYRFLSERTGDFSSDHSPFTIKVVVTDRGSRPESVAKTASHSWTLTVNNIHSAPSLVNPTPSNNLITISESNTNGQTFSIKANSPDTPNYDLVWKVDETIVLRDKGNFTFIPAYSGDYSAGEYVITVTITDEYDLSADHSWVLIVTDSNRAPVILSVSITDPQGGTEYKAGSQISLSASSEDPDNDQVSYRWESNIDGLLGTTATVKKQLHAGKHQITLTVRDSKNGQTTYISNITVAQTDGGTNGDGGSNGGGGSTDADKGAFGGGGDVLLYAIIGGVVAAVAAVVIVLLVVRKKKTAQPIEVQAVAYPQQQQQQQQQQQYQQQRYQSQSQSQYPSPQQKSDYSYDDYQERQY